MTIPNCISFVRLLLIPVFLSLLIDQLYLLAALILFFSGLSDLLDGYLARTMNQITKLGIVLDPVADKLTILAGLIYFYSISEMPLWFICVVFYRDACALTGMIALAVSHKKAVVPALKIGKISSAAAMGLLFFLSLKQIWAGFSPVVFVFYGATLFMVVASFLVYSKRWFDLFEGKESA